MASNEGTNDRGVSPERFGKVQLEWLANWIEMGLVSVQGAVNICLLSWTKEDEAGRCYAWFPAEDMAKLLGVPLKSINSAKRRLKERGFITVKKNGRKGRCTEYYVNTNGGALNPSKEKVPTVAAADTQRTGGDLSFSLGTLTSDSIIATNSVTDVENGRCLPADLRQENEAKPAFSRNSMTPEQYEALKKMGALSNGYQ